MDLSRMAERLLRLAVSTKLWFPVFSLEPLIPAHRLSVCALRSPTTCCGWCFSTGFSTHPWTSRPSCCASVTGSSTTTGGVFALFVWGLSVSDRRAHRQLLHYSWEAVELSPPSTWSPFPLLETFCRILLHLHPAAVVNEFSRLAVNLTHFPCSSILIRQQQIHYSDPSCFHVAFVWLLLQELRDGDIFLAELEHPRPQVVSAVSSYLGELNQARSATPECCVCLYYHCRGGS